MDKMDRTDKIGVWREIFIRLQGCRFTCLDAHGCGWKTALEEIFATGRLGRGFRHVHDSCWQEGAVYVGYNCCDLAARRDKW